MSIFEKQYMYIECFHELYKAAHTYQTLFVFCANANYGRYTPEGHFRMSFEMRRVSDILRMSNSGLEDFVAQFGPECLRSSSFLLSALSGEGYESSSPFKHSKNRLPLLCSR